MSEEIKTPEAPNENLPAFVKAAPELLPVWDWWVKEGKSTLAMLLVVAIAVMGFYTWKNYQKRNAAAANQVLMNAISTEDLESAVSDYGSTKVGPALRLRLAKSYYDEAIDNSAKYEEALKIYDELIKSSDNAAFADVAVVGRAYSLEGLEKYAEAQKAFEDFSQASTNSYLLLTAQLGAARCKMLGGKKDEALKDLEALKAAAKDEMAKARIDSQIDVVKRHDSSRKRQTASMFDLADSAQKSLEAEKKAEAVPAAKPAAPAPAAKPAAPAPAAKPAAPAPAAKPAAPAKK